MSSLKERLAKLALAKRQEMQQQAASKSDAELFGVSDGSEDSTGTEQTSSTDTIEANEAANTASNAPAVVSAVPAPKLTSVVNMDTAGEHFDIKLKLRELEEALHYEVPGFEKILFDIHTALRDDVSVVTIFSDEEIGVICKALKQHTNITVTTTAPKSTKKTQKFSAAEL